MKKGGGGICGQNQCMLTFYYACMRLEIIFFLTVFPCAFISTVFVHEKPILVFFFFGGS